MMHLWTEQRSTELCISSDKEKFSGASATENIQRLHVINIDITWYICIQRLALPGQSPVTLLSATDKSRLIRFSCAVRHTREFYLNPLQTKDYSAHFQAILASIWDKETGRCRDEDVVIQENMCLAAKISGLRYIFMSGPWCSLELDGR